MSGADDILSAIDQAVNDYAVSPDAMRWSPGGDTRTEVERIAEAYGVPARLVGPPPPRPSLPDDFERRPVLHNAYPGWKRYLFVGGHAHGDVMPVQPDVYTWATVGPLSHDIFAPAPEVTYYHATPYFRLDIHTFAPISRLTIFTHGSVDLLQLNNALAYWAVNGWTPEDERPVGDVPQRIRRIALELNPASRADAAAGITSTPDPRTGGVT